VYYTLQLRLPPSAEPVITQQVSLNALLHVNINVGCRASLRRDLMQDN